MDTGSESDRQSVRLAHLAMVAALFSYALLVGLLRGRLAEPGGAAGAPRGDALALPLLGIGAVQHLLATYLGNRRLPGPPSGAPSRVRSYFLIRFASAEAIGIFGLIVGFLGARPAVWAGLLAAGLVAMLASSPTREAWDAAMRRAASA
jgi:hypothetical protein